MKFLIIFALVLATTSSFDLRSANIKQRNLVVPAVKSEGRITNGQDAAVGQFPYQAGLFVTFNDLNTTWCGGCVIGRNWILTAAHCTDDMKEATVYLGATLRLEAQVNYTVSSSNVTIHPGWNRTFVTNDISLIQVPGITYNDKIQAVKLPAISNSYSSYLGESVIASGWGRVADNSDIHNHLQWARMEIISNDDCARTYLFFITPSNVCIATTGGMSTCKGDSGGPLVLESSKTLVGSSSFGYRNACTMGHPAVFTRITSYLEWIRNNTGISY